MNSADRESLSFFHTYKRLPLEIDHGSGVYLYARDGRRYLDLFGGLAVNALGYGHPAVLRAIREQSEKYIHLSNYYLQEPQIALAELLLKRSGYARVFFTNSGTESTEGALKIARRWGAQKGKTDIIGLSNGFHGRTMGALSIMDRPSYREGYGPFLPNCSVVGFNDADMLRKSVSAATAAVVVEFIQGEGGVCPVSDDFAQALASLRRSHEFILIADEIQAGLGRTGKLFGFQHYGIEPDVVLVAKPLGGGLPLGAILGSAAFAEVLSPGVHGTTFGGNPVACAAGIAVLRELYDGGVLENAAAMGAHLMSRLRALQTEFPGRIREVRGFGLMAGMDMTAPAEPVVASLRDRGVLLNCTQQTVLRFLPPLIIRREELDEGVDALRAVLASGD